METNRWLLPFTNGVDMQAINAVMDFAESAGITLVAVSLISAQQVRPLMIGKLHTGDEGPVVGTLGLGRGVRLEHIQQSKDFLEAVQYKAARRNVPMERYEAYTVDVMQSIALLVENLRCDHIVVVSREAKDMLLRVSEVQSLVENPPSVPLVLVRLPERRQRTQSLDKRASLVMTLVVALQASIRKDARHAGRTNITRGRR